MLGLPQCILELLFVYPRRKSHAVRSRRILLKLPLVFDFEWRRIEELGARKLYLYAGCISEQRDTQYRRMSAEQTVRIGNWVRYIYAITTRSIRLHSCVLYVLYVCFKFATVGMCTRVQYRSCRIRLSYGGNVQYWQSYHWNGGSLEVCNGWRFSRISHHPLMHAIRNVSSTTSPDALKQLMRFDLIFPWIKTFHYTLQFTH